ncbi:MAG TPA: L,D-transpeptidase [Thermoleophilaceae bacterium]|nr:L,D-transpeptidase [Thermoleophilaceae bacterium]
MIDPGQVGSALERIDPRDRELLALSLRRRVPDEALALVYDIDPSQLARRRAAAIERLASELGVKRGEDLGAVLKALLEEETWSGGKPELGAEFGTAGADAERPPAGAGAMPEARGSGAAAGPGAPAQPAPAASEAAADPPTPPPAPPSDASPPAPPHRAPPDGPRARPGYAPETVWAAGERSRSHLPHLALALVGLGLVALALAAGLVAVTQSGDEGQAASGGVDSGDGTRLFVPARDGPAAAPFPSDPEDAGCYPRAHANGRTPIYRKPGGRPFARLSSRTEWGTPRVLGVIERERDWLAVQAPELPNGQVAWMRAADGRVDCVRWTLHVDLSRRMLYARQGGHTERSFSVGIGRRGNPTPRGRFSVTDKLRVTDRDSPYGCCVVALTGHQTRLPPSWPGGDRLAIHATTDRASIGRPASLGCLRLSSREARWLLDTIPLGAPVFIGA